MISYKLLTLVLIAEVVVVIGIFVFICLHRLWRFFHDAAVKRKKNAFIEHYLELVNHQKPFDATLHPKVGFGKKILLQTLEDFNRNLGGQEWHAIRNQVIDTFLIQKARKKARSRFWLNRNFAARVFLLHAHLEDEPLILKLMRDKKYLVRNPATFAAIYLESEEGIRRVFEVLHHEQGYSQFIYRDALIQGSSKVFDYIILIGSQPKYHVTALKILAARSWGRPIFFLENDLQLFHYPEIRYWALKVLLRNPLIESLPYFEHAAQSKDAEIRELAMRGIGTFLSENSTQFLQKGLLDLSWEVRLEAARGLKRLGEIGVNILNSQKEGRSLEVSKYVLEFD